MSRLVSEGTRLREFQKDPAPVLALLEWLKDDVDLYVRRSVANNLNNIGTEIPAGAKRQTPNDIVTEDKRLVDYLVFEGCTQ